jgi:hypothetical protein
MFGHDEMHSIEHNESPVRRHPPMPKKIKK